MFAQESELDRIWRSVRPILASAACSFLPAVLRDVDSDDPTVQQREIEAAVNADDSPMTWDKDRLTSFMDALSTLRGAEDAPLDEAEREYVRLFEAWLRVRRVQLARARRESELLVESFSG